MPRGPHHYRIEVAKEYLSGMTMRAEAVPLADGAPAGLVTWMPLEALHTESGVAALVQWAEALPWPGKPDRWGSDKQSIMVDRAKHGREAFEVSAYDDHTEEFTDGETIEDSELEDPEAWQRVLQWAESLGTLS